jgi:uncharacterized membrane protein
VTSPPGPPRIAALDAARALGVAAMVCGHTLDALLAPAVRSLPSLEAYWRLRGLTAPLFLVVAGWAVTASVLRGRARGLAILTGRLPRVLLLLALGYALRYPAWANRAFLVGHRDTWRHFLAFDALHCIALGILLGAALLAAFEGPRARLAALGGAAAALLAAGSLLPPIEATGIPEIAFEQILRGTSPFPVLPWAAYFLAGGAVAILAERAGGARRVALGSAAAGAGLWAAAHALGLGGLAPWSPVLVALRLGQVLLVLAALALVPPRLAAVAAPLGRASLFVYVAHLPLVYGWGTWQGLAQRVGPVLGLAAALVAAAAVFAACLAAHAAAGALAPPLRAAAAALRPGRAEARPELS